MSSYLPHYTESLCERANNEHRERCRAAAAAGLPRPRKPPMTGDEAMEVVRDLLNGRKSKKARATIPNSLRFYLRHGNLSDDARAVYQLAITEIES